MIGDPVRQEWRKDKPTDEIEGRRSSKQAKASASVFPGGKKGSAKAHLHMLCFREHWKLPVYECWNDEGPPHHKRFTFKVVVEIIEGGVRSSLECYGNPQTSKKAAADNAAEGALWCLKHMGFNLLFP